jgi:hypothetical protein
MTKRSLKIILFGAAGLAFAVILLLGVMWVGLYLALSGIWPFAPLAQVTEEIRLQNGGTIVVTGIEDRGFGSDGFLFQANYLPSDGAEAEEIGSWIGYQSSPELFLVNNLVVILNPDQKRLHVRNHAGKWKWFLIQFPDGTSSFPLSHYAALTSLSEEDLEIIRNELADAGKRYSPNAYIQTFDPLNSEVIVTYYPLPGVERTLILGLTEDGTQLKLRRIERHESSSSRHAWPVLKAVLLSPQMHTDFRRCTWV